MAPKTSHDEVATANARSAAYSFFATVLAYPEPEATRAFMHCTFYSDAIQLWQRVYPSLAEQFDAIRSDLTPSSDDPTNQSAPLQSTYTEIFGHAVRGTCPPYELEYSHSDIPQQASELADVSGFYQAFGMELVGEFHERPDHVTVECEFMSVMAAKHAYAIETCNAEAQSILDDAQRSFLVDHLGKWLPAYAFRLQQADADGFYGKAAILLGQFIETESERFKVVFGPKYLEIRPAPLQDDASFQCGVEETCPGATPNSTVADAEQFVQLGIDRK